MTLANAHHIGRVGAYGEMASAAGLVSLHFVNVADHRGLVAPFRGSDPRFSTNPVCIALPGTDQQPALLLDMATSAIAMGKVRVARNEGKPLGRGHPHRPAGRPTRDPNVMYARAAGRAPAVRRPQGLCAGGGDRAARGRASPAARRFSPETSGAAGPSTTCSRCWSIPARLAGVDWLRREIDGFVDYVKASPPTDPKAPRARPRRPGAPRARGSARAPASTWTPRPGRRSWPPA